MGYSYKDNSTKDRGEEVNSKAEEAISRAIEDLGTSPAATIGEEERVLESLSYDPEVMAKLEEDRRLRETLSKIEKIVTDHEEAIKSYYAASLEEKLEQVLRHYQRIAANHLTGVKDFNSQVVIYLRSIALLVQTVGSAQTHGEKNARLRGLTDLLETAISNIQSQDFNFSASYYRLPDLFQADFSSRFYLGKIAELEGQLREERTKAAAVPKAPEDKAELVF